MALNSNNPQQTSKWVPNKVTSECMVNLKQESLIKIKLPSPSGSTFTLVMHTVLLTNVHLFLCCCFSIFIYFTPKIKHLYKSLFHVEKANIKRSHLELPKPETRSTFLSSPSASSLLQTSTRSCHRKSNKNSHH